MLCLLALLPSLALAQDRVEGETDIFGPEAGDWEVTLSGTGSNNNDFEGGSGGMSGSIGYFFTEEIELSLRQSLSVVDFGESSSSFSTRVAVDYHFDLDRLRPFIGASFGGVYGDDVNDTFIAGLEGGAKYYVLPKTFLYGLIEYQFFFDDGDDADDNFDDGQFVYTVGIGFHF
jgi:hypothetical protein